MSRKLVGVFLLVAAATACAAKAPVAGSSDEVRASAPRNRDLITLADLSADPAMRSQSVLEVVRTLRPHFLTDRGPDNADPNEGKVHVSIDDGRIVPLSELSTMHANEVIEIRYLNSGQAMQKFGSTARRGPVIVVRTR